MSTSVHCTSSADHPDSSDDDPFGLRDRLSFAVRSNRAERELPQAERELPQAERELPQAPPIMHGTQPTDAEPSRCEEAKQDADAMICHQPVLGMETWTHQDRRYGCIQTLASKVAAQIGTDPIRFAIPILATQSTARCAHTLLQILHSFDASAGHRGRDEIAEAVPKQICYVGTTVWPPRRWNGENLEEFQAWRNENPRGRVRPLEKGHKIDYCSLFLLGVAEHRTAALLEPYLIDLAKCFCRRESVIKCNNKASDSRGMAQGMNWLYVCVGKERAPQSCRRWLGRKRPAALAFSSGSGEWAPPTPTHTPGE